MNRELFSPFAGNTIMDTSNTSELAKLLLDGDFLNVPKLGDLIIGKVVATKGREVRIDVNGLTTGVVRGRELFAESDAYSDLKPGDEVEATVVGLENEAGEMELSFRYAGNKKSWEEIRTFFESGEAMSVKVLDANKGGLIVKVQHVSGFLPVSQLAPEHYPRVTGGDKQKILDKLKDFVGSTMKVKVLDMNEADEKLIMSEKAIWESEQKNVISQISVGDVIEGEITALADFGAFIKFNPKGEPETNLEGLVHISEIAWQRIDHPKDILTAGEAVKAEVIGIEGSKIFLSIKKMQADPWSGVEEKYKVGETVEGTVLKVNPFGLFVELDKDIHGLAHISELSDQPVEDVNTIAKSGDVVKFKIVSIEPKEHRLGLSLKAMDSKPTKEAVETEEEVTESLPSTSEEPVEEKASKAETPSEAPAEEVKEEKKA
jgi:small subunit ribosomal protein S1